jgi:hypothetical protein
MSVIARTFRKAGRMVSSPAVATTEAAGAVGGAAVNGVIGGAKGAADGIQRGLGTRSRAVPVVALAAGAIGAAGLVDWPLLLALGGGALVLQRMGRTPDESSQVAKGPLTSVPSKAAPAKSGPRTTSSRAPRKTSARRVSTA